MGGNSNFHQARSVKMFRIGEALGNYHIAQQYHNWNPDDDAIKNPHMIIAGESGSGKTALLRRVIAYLHAQHKNIYVLDLHGDLDIDSVETNNIKLTARNSLYGINPFEFDTDDTEIGGINSHIPIMIKMFQKEFMKNMGSKQKIILQELFKDTYAMQGIVEENDASWIKPLPTMQTLLDLISMILEPKRRKSDHINVLSRMHYLQQSIVEMDVQGLCTRHASTCASLRDTDEHHNFIKKLAETYKTHVAKQIHSAIVELNTCRSQLNDEVDALYTFTPKPKQTKTMPVPINFEKYQKSSTLAVLEELEVYISTIAQSGIFSDNRPPVKAGLNRFDLSKLTDSMQSFFVDTFAYKIFRATKRRGEYQRLPNKKRGNKVDTYIVIDEGRTILPTEKEKNNHELILNKIMYESRKFGLGLIFVGQTPTQFSKPILSAYTKVILKQSSNEKTAAQKLLGISDKRLFDTIDTPYYALIGRGSKFQPVDLSLKKRGVNGVNETAPRFALKTEYG